MPGKKKAEAVPHLSPHHPYYCCDPDAPCELHTSTTDRKIILTSKELRDAIRARAEQEGTTPKDLVLRVLNTYLGRVKAADAWAGTMPLNVPGWVADKLTAAK
jgi:hypothetical protein